MSTFRPAYLDDIDRFYGDADVRGVRADGLCVATLADGSAASEVCGASVCQNIKLNPSDTKTGEEITAPKGSYLSIADDIVTLELPLAYSKSSVVTLSSEDVTWGGLAFARAQVITDGIEDDIYSYQPLLPLSWWGHDWITLYTDKAGDADTIDDIYGADVDNMVFSFDDLGSDVWTDDDKPASVWETQARTDTVWEDTLNNG